MTTNNRDGKRGERGMALLLAIVFLGILSFIGAMVIRYVNEGLQTAGKIVPEKRTFNVADRGVEYALNRDIILELAGGTPGPDNTIKLHDPGECSVGGVPCRNLINGNSAGLIEGTVTDLGPGEMPAGVSGLFGTDFSANYYQVQVKTGSPAPSYDNPAADENPKASYLNDVANGRVTVTHVNASIVRLFKLDDDTIFRTTGGG